MTTMVLISSLLSGWVEIVDGLGEVLDLLLVVLGHLGVVDGLLLEGGLVFVKLAEDLLSSKVDETTQIKQTRISILNRKLLERNRNNKTESMNKVQCAKKERRKLLSPPYAFSRSYCVRDCLLFCS